MIQISNLTKTYQKTLALDAISFSFESGKIYGLLGGNGAGKTRAWECIGGLRSYDDGTIRIHGKIGIQLQSGCLQG